MAIIGPYAVERDYSHYVAKASDTILALVGTATKGPINEVVSITGSQDLINKFGTLKTNCYALYAAQYFLSQSSSLYFVRAASDSAAPATAKIEGTDADESKIEDSVTISLKEYGTFGNKYSITVSETEEAFKYNIVLKSALGNTIEIIKNIDITELVEGYETANFKVTATNALTAKLNPGTYELSGGNDGIDDITPADYINAGEKLRAEQVDMNLFAVPGVSDASVIVTMLAIAESRGDALFIVDPPKGLTREGVVNWHNGGGEYQHAAFNSSYGALYYDWVNIYDSINKTRVTVPPSVAVCEAIAYSDRISHLWYAPAGLTRGVLRGVLNTESQLSKADIELMYNDNNNINSIYEDPQAGLVIWGQKTLQRTETALNRVNVRRLLNYLKRVVVAACKHLTFDPNDRITWNSFEMKIEPILKNLVKNRGIYSYRIVKGESIVTAEDIDNYRMPCMVAVRPTKAAEEIPIYFVITSTGADFNEVLEANGVILE